MSAPFSLWGLRRGFNEAGAFLPRKQHGNQGDERVEVASMRPGHFCPGNPLHNPHEVRLADASMRPGHFCPGNAAYSAKLI